MTQNPEDIDVFADAEQGPSAQGLEKLRQMFDRRQALASEAEELSARLKVVEEDLRDLDEKQFPDLFDEVGIESFTADGKIVSVATKLYGSMPSKPEDREAAIEELRRNDGLGVLKAEISLMFPKSEAEKAEALAARLEEAGYEPTLRENAHPSTYRAWVGEQLEKGVDLNLSVLGIYNRRFIQIKEKK